MKAFLTATVATAALVGRALADLPEIEIKGSKFFFSNGSQFFMRGVAYQQDYAGNGTVSTNTTYMDPLTYPDYCQRDIPYLQALSTNIIRVYAINPTENHDQCMSMLQDAGIYVIADLSAPVYGQSIDRSNPSWNDDLYARYTSVVDALQGYSNVVGFFAGNEVSNQPNNTDAAPFVKAAVRDTKAYIRAKGYRTTLGVGYATDDDASIRDPISDYFNCGNQTDAVDFWGYNIYSWCGESTYSTSGYQARTEFFQNWNVPVFFAEYGCNTQGTRIFTEVQALYGSQMTPVWSGGIVYMYFQETNNYGLVSIDSNNNVVPNQGYTNLKNQLASVTPSSTSMNAYTPTNSPQACPTEGDGVWEASASPLPPSPNELLCSCMYASLDCVVNPSASTDGYADLFNQVFSYMANDGGIPGIAANGTTATYGAYGMCNSTQQLGWAFNAYYKSQNSASTACDFGGNATTQSGTTASGCSGLLGEAGASGTGTVTSAPQTSVAGGSGSGKGSSTSTSKGAAAGATFAAPSMFRDLGLLPVYTITALAAISGMGMVFL